MNTTAPWAASAAWAADPAIATKFYDKACKAKDPQACYNLADSAETGVGVKQDDKRALQLFDQACRMGHAEGCKRAALLRQGPK